MDKTEYIAYSGEQYTIEWYFNTKPYSQSLEYYCNLSMKERIKAMKLIRRMGDFGEIKDKTKFRYENHKIYTFKPKPDRFLCFFYDKNKIIITNAFRKKQQKIPKNELEKALSSKQDYINRINKGNYYD